MAGTVKALFHMLQGIEKLKQNPEELERIVKNHIVRGKVRPKNIPQNYATSL